MAEPAGTLHAGVADEADFATIIRYAQVWEDADILLEGLDIQPGDHCLSIASAGDNALAMLTRHPARVVALDLNPSQIACLELRVAAYRTLAHGELLGLMGSRPHPGRRALYARCAPLLSEPSRRFWDGHAQDIDHGIGSAGKFERYFSLFRRRVLPLIHSRRMVAAALRPRTPQARAQFYSESWDTVRWRAMFRLFFSKPMVARLGRDPRLFAYVEGTVADRMLARTRHAFTTLDPAQNPYLQWILLGTHGSALPLALRPEHFEVIRDNLDRLEWHCESIERFLSTRPDERFQRHNLSDIFEYVSPQHYRELLTLLVDHAPPGARLAYWNMLVPRHRPAELAGRLQPLTELSQRLHEADMAFFYSAFVVEQVIA